MSKIGSILAAVFTAGSVWAGGSGLNVIVVVNQRSTNSVQLGNEYCEARGVPPQNVFRLTDWAGGAITWSRAEFETRLRNPLLAMLAERGLAKQAEFVLLSMDIPYRVVDGGSANSTTSALFYGFKTNTTAPGGLPIGCSLPDHSLNSYAFSEMPFIEAHPDTADTNSFLAMMLTDTSLPEAELILNRGVAADSSFPTQTVVLARTSDASRSVRHVSFDNAILEARVRGDDSLVRVESNSTSLSNLFGLTTGLQKFSLPANAFVPGAMGDSLTSYGGYILESTGQTSLLAFLKAGAAGSYGIVVEGCNYVEKFPDPLNYMYQHRGFSLAEAYYQSLQNPHQGLLVGEPLCATFALRGTGDWSSLPDGSVLSGRAALDLAFHSAATNLPLGQVDLFLDGTLIQTVTNLPPSPGNRVSAILNGVTVNFSIPLGATVASAARGLASALTAREKFTRVSAIAAGDRVILRSLDPAKQGGNVTLSTSVAAGSAQRLTTLLPPARPTFLDSTATGYLWLLVSNTPAIDDWLNADFTLTNGTVVSVSVTNATAGTTIGSFVQRLVNKINSTPALQTAEGVSAADFFAPSSIVAAQFKIYARSPGWPAAQIQVALTASPNLLTLPQASNRLEDNLSDLQPRNHLYVSSGLTELPVSFEFDTTRFPDGYHELIAVAYEGTSVRTQTHVSRAVRIQNTDLTATLVPLFEGTNVTSETPLQFEVAANTTNNLHIELFSTGGSIGAVTNQEAAVFTVLPADLGLGLHPFYAVVTDTSGSGYRTETVWIRLAPSLQLSITDSPLTLTWPAIPGQQYDVLATKDLSDAFEVMSSLTASNSIGRWTIPTPALQTGFYLVRLTP